jgi:hypothetical protein
VLLGPQVATVQPNDFARDIQLQIERCLAARPQWKGIGIRGSTGIVQAQDRARASVGPLMSDDAQLERMRSGLPRHIAKQILEHATQPACVGKHRPGSWSAGTKVDLHIAGSVLEVGGTRVSQLDQIDLTQLQGYLSQPNALDFKDGRHPPSHDVGLLDDVAGDLARGLGLQLAIDLQLESLGVRAEGFYWRLELACDRIQHALLRRSFGHLVQQGRDARRRRSPVVRFVLDNDLSTKLGAPHKSTIGTPPLARRYLSVLASDL